MTAAYKIQAWEMAVATLEESVWLDKDGEAGRHILASIVPHMRAMARVLRRRRQRARTKKPRGGE
jgi:hypothetical protein